MVLITVFIFITVAKVIVLISGGQICLVTDQQENPLLGPDEVTVKPVAPGPEDNVTINILVYLPNGGYGVDDSMEMNGSIIWVSLRHYYRGGVVPQIVIPWSTDIALGNLEHGEYSILIRSTYSDQGEFHYNTYSQTFIVADRYVDPLGTHGHISIKNAIENATDGDIIRVFSGSYHEGLNFNKTLSIIGNGTDSTVVRSNNMVLNASKVTFSDISFIVGNIDNGGEEGGEAGNGNGGEDGIFWEIHHMNLLEFLIAVQLILFLLLGLVVRKKSLH